MRRFKRVNKKGGREREREREREIVQTPMKLKARKTIFMGRLDRHVEQHSKDEIKREIEKNNEWDKYINVVKMKD